LLTTIFNTVDNMVFWAVAWLFFVMRPDLSLEQCVEMACRATGFDVKLKVCREVSDVDFLKSVFIPSPVSGVYFMQPMPGRVAKWLSMACDPRRYIRNQVISIEDGMRFYARDVANGYAHVSREFPVAGAVLAIFDVFGNATIRPRLSEEAIAANPYGVDYSGYPFDRQEAIDILSRRYGLCEGELMECDAQIRTLALPCVFESETLRKIISVDYA